MAVAARSGLTLGAPRIAGLAFALVAAVAWPLLTYTFSLAAFGLVHVLAELRYVDRRFSLRLGRASMATIAAGALGIAAARIAARLGAPDMRAVELVFGALLVVVVLPRLRGSARVLGAVLVAVLTVGLLVSPLHALLTLAVLHNLTPLGFVADAGKGRALVHAAIVFVALPVVIAFGLPWEFVDALGVAAPEAGWLFPGPLEMHMRAYLPEQWLGTRWALHAFSACAFAQCAHYLYVIDILPRGLLIDDRGLAPWPRRWPALLVLLGAGAFAAFATGNFLGVRGWYGVLAAVHAWIELPILLLAIGVRPLR